MTPRTTSPQLLFACGTCDAVFLALTPPAPVTALRAGLVPTLEAHVQAAHRRELRPEERRPTWRPARRQHLGRLPVGRRRPVAEGESVLRAVQAWQAETFTRATTASVLAHLRREVAELAAAPTDPSEWADVLILAVGGLGTLGLDAETEVRRKLDLNRTRQWAEPDAEGVVEHRR